MRMLRSRLAMSIVSIVWVIIFSRPEVILPSALRWGAIGLALGVGLHHVRSFGGSSVVILGPLSIFSNLALGILLLIGVATGVDAGLVFIMLLAFAQALLFFLLFVTEQRLAFQRHQASSGLLNERTQQLLYLQQVGIALNSTEEIRSFLDVVLSAASHVTKAERILLFLRRADGTLHLEALRGVEADKDQVDRVKDHALTRSVFNEGVEVVHPSLDEHEAGVDESAAELPLCRGQRGVSFMQLPLIRKDGVWGVFHAERCGDGESDRFSLADVEVFRVLASQISVALENADLYFRMRENYRSTIEALAAAIEAKDAYTSGHSSAVTEFAVPVAREMELSGLELETVEFASILHDIGKIAIPESVLNKPGKLTNEEFDNIKRHPVIGAEIIKSVGFLQDAYLFIRHHHERWDGRGYPDGLKGDAIPLGAQIIGVVDTFDAMTSTRSYRKALSEDDAVKEIVRCSGSQFNPDVVDAFLRAYRNGRIHRDEERVDGYLFTKDGSFRAEGVGEGGLS